ncbi:YihY/virulence factor BrkB family protein [Nocardia yunnanensis]|nr:YhjD/YihY/BrkB family envelope integrity protein [Nocardia yunnanensis]
MNPVERVQRAVRWVDTWQQRHRPAAFVFAVFKKFGDDQAGNLVSLLTYNAFLATFPLLLVLVTITGIVLRNHAGLQRQVVNSAFSEFPIVGGQLHEQLGVTAFQGTGLALTVGIVGAVWGARGFANAVQNTLNTLWAIPKVDRPGFPGNLLRSIGLLAVLAFTVAVPICAAALTAAGSRVGLSGLPAQLLVLVVSSLLDGALFLGVFRLATAAQVSTRALIPGAFVAGVAWQLLLNLAGVLLSHTVRHAEAIAGLFGIVLGLLSWFALQATITVYAIEADVVRALKLWPRSLTQPPLTRADKSYLTAVTGAEARRPEQRIDVEFTPPDRPAPEK